MWRLPSASRILGRSLTGVSAALPYRQFWTDHKNHPGWIRQSARHCSSKASTSVGVPQESMTPAEAKRQMRLANVEALKRRLCTEGSEVIGYSKLLEVCEGMGIAGSKEEAATFARILDETGVVLLFRDQVYLHPDKVVDLVRRAVPLALSPRNDPRLEELKQLQKKKEEIDNLAHKQVRRILWSGLGLFVAQVGLFFRLTFWELSWDVMEPITFFATTTGILVGYAYFLFTSKDPTYQDLMKRLFQSRQKKLFQKMNFNLDRLTELQNHYRFPLECCSEVTKTDVK